ncbi:MAG: hypothetical protein WBA63_14645 [Thermomicrobiales bacterium]
MTHRVSEAPQIDICGLCVLMTVAGIDSSYTYRTTEATAANGGGGPAPSRA